MHGELAEFVVTFQTDSALLRLGPKHLGLCHMVVRATCIHSPAQKPASICAPGATARCITLHSKYCVGTTPASVPMMHERP